MIKFTSLLYIVFFLSVGLLALLSANYFKRLQILDINIKKVEESNRLLHAMEEISSMLFTNSTELRDMILLNDFERWPSILEYNEQLINKLDTIRKHNNLKALQKDQLNLIETIIKHRLLYIKDSLNPVQLNKIQNQRKILYTLKSLLDSFRMVHLSIMENESNNLQKMQIERLKQNKITDPLLITFLSLAGLMITAIFVYLIITLNARNDLQLKLQEKIETLNIANNELENLSRITSHHIQEPMRKIRNFSSLIQKRIKDIPREDIKQIVSKIELNAGSLQTLAQNLARYGNLIIDHRPKEKIDLNNLIEDVIYRLDDMIYENKAVVKHEPLPAIYGIPYQLFLLFHELIQNSLQYTKEKEKAFVYIYHDKSINHNLIRIIVSDKGIGIPEEYAERVFRIFEKLEPGNTKGKGIGLAICSRIMVNHGGSIRAVSNEYLGTNILLDFPITN